MSSHAGSRFVKILEKIKEEKVDCLLLGHTPNVSYGAGFHAPDSYMVAGKKGLALVTDFRYTQDFLKLARPPLEVVELKGTIFKTLCGILAKNNYKKVGFESRHLSFAECQTLHDLSKKRFSFIPLKDTLEEMRAIKEEGELALIRTGLRITERTYDFIRKNLKPGITELSLAAEIERFIRLQGASGSAFDTIVASGPNASYPHAQISERKIQKGEPVIIDLGVVYHGYRCDLTRTFFLGKINPVVRRAASIVEEAQQRAIRAIRPGVPIKKVDAAARNYIKEKGFGKNFGHALGHGVGLEVHEAPSINKMSDLSLKKGMVFTIEPGIYVPDSFGIRREDMVLVTDSGVEVLSGNNRH